MLLIVMGELDKAPNTHTVFFLFFFVFLSTHGKFSLHSGNALNQTAFALLGYVDVIPSKMECITFPEAVEH